MDVREQLETRASQPGPEWEAGLQLYRRGRRRVRRRRAIAAGGAAAAVVVGVLAWTGTTPGSDLVVDDMVGAPEDNEPDDRTGPDRDDAPTADTPDTLDAPADITVGDVELTVPAGVVLQSHGVPVPTPCHPGTTTATVYVLTAGIDPEVPDCEGAAATATSIVVATASRMPPAYLPGEGTPDADLDVTPVELLGTPGTSESYAQQDGAEVTSYAFGELDLYLAVRGPDLTPELVGELLGSARLRSESGSSAPTAADETLIARFLRFASDPTAPELPFGDEVALGLADDLLVTRTRAQLADPAAWRLEGELFRGYVGPFSALELAAGRSPTDTVVSRGEHPRCASPPEPPPADLASHRRVSVQPDPQTIDSCLGWWTVDLYVADDDTITAITLDLYEP